MPMPPVTVSIAGNANKVVVTNVRSRTDHDDAASFISESSRTDDATEGSVFTHDRDDADTTTSSSCTAPTHGKPSINRVGVQDLMNLKMGSIGEKISLLIVENRPYSSWAEVRKRVLFVGEKRIKVLKEHLSLDAA